jgi:hypothetical protein
MPKDLNSRIAPMDQIIRELLTKAKDNPSITSSTIIFYFLISSH